ncbi:MAG TPA: glycosyltransferase family 1 protein [candidate division Zixibacteria bacterium]|nr:glycosyltransferase family 1 protein [candidate division Zixibacteria bacterium]
MRLILGADLLDDRRCGMRICLESFLDEVARQKRQDELDLLHGVPLGHDSPQGFRSRLVPYSDGRGAKLIWSQIRLPVWLRQTDYEVIHWPYQIMPPGRSPIPLTVAVWDLAPMLHREPGWGRFSTALKYEMILGRALRNAAHIITHSRAVAHDIVEKFKIAPEAISVIYPGLSSRFQTEAENEVVSPAGHGILYVGTDTTRKNLNLLLEAYGLLVKDGCREPLRLRVTDDEKHQKIIRERARSFKIPKELLLFESAVNLEGLIALYRDVRLLVFPSLYEGFGLPMIEAMACGVPVVALNCSTMPEVLGDAGLLVDEPKPRPFADRIAECLAWDNDRRRQRIEAGRKQALRFQWSTSVEQHFQVWEAVACNTAPTDVGEPWANE